MRKGQKSLVYQNIWLLVPCSSSPLEKYTQSQLTTEQQRGGQVKKFTKILTSCLFDSFPSCSYQSLATVHITTRLEEKLLN